MKINHLLAIYRLDLEKMKRMTHWMFLKDSPKIIAYNITAEGNIIEFEPYDDGDPGLQKDKYEIVLYYSIDAHVYMECNKENT